jgi:hypothetical protein
VVNRHSPRVQADRVNDGLGQVLDTGTSQMFFKVLRLSFAAIIACASTSGWAKAETCYADWGAAAQIVRQFNLITVDRLSREMVGGIGGQIVKTTLCKDGDDYIYKLVVREPTGQLKTVVMGADARSAAAATKR